MDYQALARQWRPRRFEDVVGQEHIIQALSHALSAQKLHHAYLFTGTHGTGKTTTARIFAKCLNCEQGMTPTPCDHCPACRSIDEGRFPDLIEIDAASRTKVEDTRELLDNIPYAPTQGRFKIYLIDEVHMLSNHSFNALLKTLEEPPSHVKFLLATTDPQKLPATVLSRCLQFHLSRITPDIISKQLEHILQSEKIIFEKEALDLIAEAADGSLRDSLSLLDQCIAYCQSNITCTNTEKMLGLSNQADVAALITAIDAQDGQTALALTEKWAHLGANFARCLEALTHYLFIQAKNQLLKLPAATNLSAENIQLYYQIALTGQRDLPLAPTERMGFEMIVMRMIAFHPTFAGSPVKLPAQTAMTPKSAPLQHPTATPLNAAMNASTSTDEWIHLFNQLGLTGPTLALAQHCGLQKLTENELQLSLQTKYSALLNDRQKARLQEAVSRVLNKPVRVTITTTSEVLVQTPATEAAHHKASDTATAKQAINTDPTVQRMVAAFGANVVENSIEPLK